MGIMMADSGFPGSASGKESTCQYRRSIPGLGRSPGGGHGNPLQYSCLGNSIDKRSLSLFTFILQKRQ